MPHADLSHFKLKTKEVFNIKGFFIIPGLVLYVASIVHCREWIDTQLLINCMTHIMVIYRMV